VPHSSASMIKSTTCSKMLTSFHRPLKNLPRSLPF
jgi:hypothetical protein